MSFPEELKLSFLMECGKLRLKGIKGRPFHLFPVRTHYRRRNYKNKFKIMLQPQYQNQRGLFQATMTYYIHKYTKIN